jgi:hypothetical protein
MSEIRIKRGASLNLALAFRRGDGLAADVTHMVLTSQVRDPQGRLVATLPLVKQPEIGEVTVTVLDTTQWPIGRLRCDLTAAAGGQVLYSETFAVQVAREVTQS